MASSPGAHGNALGPSPTARALRTLEILQARPGGTTAEQLGERLGVTERAARRYVEILREAGVAVESARGPHGGYRLRRGGRLPPVVFTQDEAIGLVMAVLDGRPAASGEEDLVGTALGKVIRALPDGIGRQATALRATAAAVPDRHASYPDPATVNALVEAVEARQQVVVEYRAEPGGSWSTTVDPWAVVVRHARWYLLCRSHRADAVRTYRIDRMLSVERTAEPFTPPEDLDPVAVFEENLSTGWGFPTRVVFDAPFEKVAPWVHAAMGRLEPLGDARCLLVGSTRNPLMYVQEWLAGIPYPFRVEGGDELRTSVAQLVATLTAAIVQP